MEITTINSCFNEELQRQIEGKLSKGHVYQLGMPSNALLSRLENLPIQLRATTLNLKSATDYIHSHPFDLVQIKNLPQALSAPIAVFESETNFSRTVVLTELKNNSGSNFIAIIDVQRLAGRQVYEVNNIISLYPKASNDRILRWFDGKNDKEIGRDLLCWVDTQKALNWLSNASSNVSRLGSPIKRIAKIIQDFQNPKFLEEKMNVPKATPSQALKQIIDNTPTTIKKQIDMKKTLTLALLLSATVCGAQTHFPKNFNVDLGGGVNDAGCYTPVVAVGYTFNNWFALYGRYSFATDKVEDGRLTYWEHTGEIYPSFTVLSYMDKWFVSPFVGVAYKYQDLLGIPTSSRDVTGHNFGAVIGMEGEWHFARYLSAFASVSYRGLFFKEEPRYEPFASVGVRTSMRVFKKAGRRR
jgi:hypothetical protein